jgi:hypothetical protein
MTITETVEAQSPERDKADKIKVKNATFIMDDGITILILCVDISAKTLSKLNFYIKSMRALTENGSPYFIQNIYMSKKS